MVFVKQSKDSSIISLKTNGYDQYITDPCLFRKKNRDEFAVLNIHVDDIFLAYFLMIIWNLNSAITTVKTFTHT